MFWKPFRDLVDTFWILLGDLLETIGTLSDSFLPAVRNRCRHARHIFEYVWRLVEVFIGNVVETFWSSVAPFWKHFLDILILVVDLMDTFS